MNRPPIAGDEAAPSLTGHEVRRRAVVGAALIGGRGILTRALGAVGFLVLAKFLEPREFGTVAFGLTLSASVAFFMDGGLGVTLLRRKEPPTQRELRSVVGFQLLTTTAFAAVVAAIAVNFGQPGVVTAAMVALFPLSAWRTVNVVVLERELVYGPIVRLEIAEVAAFQVVSIAGVAAGAGVWGVVAGVSARAVAGFGLMVWKGPVGFRLPRLDWGLIRPMLRFAGGFQAISVGNLVRDQGLNLGVAAFGGLTVLGLWSLAYRILQVPFLLFDSLWRVSFPATARLLAAGEDPRPVIERGISIVGVAAGALLAAVIAAGPGLIEGVLGERWSEVGDVLRPAAIGLMIGGPISVATAGFLFAAGNTAAALRGVVLHTLAWFALAFPLLGVIGVAAVGYGWLLANLVEALVLGVAAARWTKARILAPIIAPGLAFEVAAGVGIALTWTLPSTVLTAIVSGVAAEAIFLAVLYVLRRELLLDILRLVRGVRRGAQPASDLA